MKNFHIYNSMSGSDLGIYQAESEYEALVALNNDAGGDDEWLDKLIEDNNVIVDEIYDNVIKYHSRDDLSIIISDVLQSYDYKCYTHADDHEDLIKGGVELLHDFIEESFGAVYEEYLCQDTINEYLKSKFNSELDYYFS